eukprot:m.154729 g.154729  ORF g.154729 m.154729 type:complete len:602 (+) comp9794_c1_seq2:44-1849(+)
MIELFSIFTYGGLVLFSCKDQPGQALEGPVNDLIHTVLIENKGDTKLSHTSGIFGLQYRKSNELSLIFVVVYRKNLEDKLTYVGELLDRVSSVFADAYREGRQAPDDFSETFARIRSSVESNFRAQQAQPKKAVTPFSRDGKKDDKPKPAALSTSSAASPPTSPVTATETFKSDDDDDDDDDADSPDAAVEDNINAKLEKLRQRKLGAGKKGSAATSPVEKTKKTKAGRVWDLAGRAGNAGSAGDGDVVQDTEIERLKAFVGQGRGELHDINEAEAAEAAKAPAATGGVFAFFKNLGSGVTITEEMLEPVLEQTRLHLIGKNVAAEAAQKLVYSVRDSLVGKSKGTFEGIASVVRSALEKSLTQILTPGRNIDVLRDVKAAKARHEPYSVVFCGVNGVGKSTNLSKISYWLIENGVRVLIAACDTFRAGAVEQLKTHVRKLNTLYPGERIKLYEQGYGKDDAEIARQAITFARNEKYDVVLIDTAGRMQDNEDLMRSLAKILQVNRPDLVLFVGDALAGNEASDQLSKFNKALEYVQAGSSVRRTIDAIVLTKFDTIDDKVGASVSMTYQNGQPILFVGTGQDYPDLKRLNVGAVVQALIR